MPRDFSPLDPDSFDFGPPRQLRPHGTAAAEFLRGYYELERSERHATAQAVALHREQITSWYQLLDAYYRALDVPRVNSDDIMWVTIWKILRLGIVAAKSALDAALAGYYVGAFGDVRQMAEYWFGIQYLALHPESVAGFYAPDPGETPVRLPRMGARIASVLSAFHPGGTRASAEAQEVAQFMNRTYRRMSDGHHLDGLALVQTGDVSDPGYYLGAGYQPGLLEEAFYHGCLMTGALALASANHMAAFNPSFAALISQIGGTMGELVARLPPKNGVPSDLPDG